MDEGNCLPVVEIYISEDSRIHQDYISCSIRILTMRQDDPSGSRPIYLWTIHEWLSSKSSEIFLGDI